MADVALSQRDLTAVLEAAESFLNVSSIEELRQCAVETVSVVLPAAVVSWNEVDLKGGQLAMVRSDWELAPTDPDRLRELDEAFINNVMEHPVIALYQRTHDGRPYAISDFLSVADFHRTNLYQQLYRPLGIEDQISFALPDPKLVVGIAANRERRGFPARDRMMCNLLRAHLVHAWRHVVALQRARLMLEVVHQLADDHGEAALSLGRDGLPEQMSSHALELLQRYFGAGGPRQLPEELNTWLGRQPATAGPPLLRRQDGRSLAIRRVHDGKRDILFLYEKPEADPAADARQLGLTPRETQIVPLLADGLTSKRIASTLSISPRTVDKHIATILDKIGVRTRLEAVSLLGQHGWHTTSERRRLEP